MYQGNIVDAFMQSTADEQREGIQWYPRAHALALELSPDNVWRGAGVIAALSPLKNWDINERLARNAFATGIASGNIGQHNAKAQRILDGEHPLQVMKGLKTRAFCTSIVDYQTDLVTVDSHAYSIAIGQWTPASKANYKPTTNREISAAYREVADWLDLLVSELQAITWLSWRRRHPISVTRKGVYA